VKSFLPNVVPARCGAPGGLPGGYTLQSLPEVGAVPGLLVKGFIEEREYGGTSVHQNGLLKEEKMVLRRGVGVKPEVSACAVD
jgi:hypothetical protein